LYGKALPAAQREERLGGIEGSCCKSYRGQMWAKFSTGRSSDSDSIFRLYRMISRIPDEIGRFTGRVRVPIFVSDVCIGQLGADCIT